MKVTYNLISDYCNDDSLDYVGIEVFINDQYDGTLTGYCSPDAIRKILKEEAQKGDENDK